MPHPPTEKTGVIYTCITGGYDSLLEHAYRDPHWDYVCFTDDLTLKNAENHSWRIEPLFFSELDNVRNQRWHKIHPHILFPKYKYSIYVDGNINFTGNDVFEDTDRAIKNNYKIAMAPHFNRNCIYDEAQECIVLGKDHKEVIEKQIKSIRENGFPEKQGLFDTSIIFRDHHDGQVISLMDDWWRFIMNYSRRDQLSLTYASWKQKYKIDQLTDISYHYKVGIKYIHKESHITKEEIITIRSRLLAAINEKDDELTNLLNSRSWRLTRPLRQVMNFVRYYIGSLKMAYERIGRKGEKCLPSGDQEKSFIEKRETIMEQFLLWAGYSPNIDNPRTFNEKVQWLKLYYRDPLMTQCADKYKVRDYIKENIGEEYLIKLLGVYDDVNQIEFDKLPDKFVLKVNHGCAQNIICENKDELDIEDAKNKLREWLKPGSNHYYFSYEWSYKNIKPNIVCEAFIGTQADLKDYKFMCFNGRVKLMYVSSERKTGLKIDFFDLTWRKLPFINSFPNSQQEIRKPKNFDLMVSLAEKLARPFPLVRVDLYEVDGRVYTGEMTFYPNNGFRPFNPEEWDCKLGDMLKLPHEEDGTGRQFAELTPYEKQAMLNQINGLQQIIREQDQEIASFLQSRSWRLTEPLRRMKSRFNQILVH